MSYKMTTNYETFTNISEEKYIIRTDVNGVVSYIPCNEANADYQAYLNKDQAEQSTPSVTNGD
jgi:hypothetical protein